MPGGKLIRVPRRRKRNKGLTKTQARTVKKIAKNVAMSIHEKKVFGFQEENVQLFHNKPLYVQSLLSNKQGLADANDLSTRNVRDGDSFYLRNVNVRFWLSNKLDRPNCMYKLYLFWYESGVTLTDAIVYFTQTNKMLDRINNEKITLLDTKTIFSGPMYLNGTEKFEHSYLATLNKSWKSHKITYNEGGASPKKRDIGVCVAVYDAYGTLQTDNIASIAYNGKITFQDP
jgi:hypothetical protein